MEERKVKLRSKEVTIHELKYKDIASLGQIPQEDAAKVMIQLSLEMSDEEYDDLSVKDGIELQKAINELNGLEDFQQPPK